MRARCVRVGVGSERRKIAGVAANILVRHAQTERATQRVSRMIRCNAAARAVLRFRDVAAFYLRPV